MTRLRHVITCFTLFGLFQAATVAHASLAGIVEIDLIFPKNATTYEPTEMLPFVWAVQNANLAAILKPRIFALMSNPGQNISDDIDMVLNTTNMTGHDIYYAYVYSKKFILEGDYFINWGLVCHNCTDPMKQTLDDRIDYENDDIAYGGQIISSFMIRKGAQKADFKMAHDADCSNTRSARFNITGTQPRFQGDDRPENQCALLSHDTPFPHKSDPCAVKVDSDAAASITSALQAAFTHAKCSGFKPIAGCPDESAAGHLNRQSPIKAVILLLAASVVWAACGGGGGAW